MYERIELTNLLASEPRIIEVEGKIVNVDGFIFTQGVVKRMIIENYAGLRQIRFVSDALSIAKLPLFRKIECTVEQTIEDGNEIVVVNIR